MRYNSDTMQMLIQFFSRFFTAPQNSDSMSYEQKSFFDYSSSEKIKILRAAGKEAQREQQQLLKTYEARFGRAI